MDLASAKMIGAGLACIALVGAGVGIGSIFSALVSSIARNPLSAGASSTASRAARRTRTRRSSRNRPGRPAPS